jgi:hypothetical protein
MKWLKLDCVNQRTWSLAVPQRAGVYVVIGDGRAVYVGSSTRLRDRLTAHQLGWKELRPLKFKYKTPWGIFDSLQVKYRLSVRFGDWAMRELRLIDRLRPVGNVRFPVRERR